MKEQEAKQWVAHWRGNEDPYTRSKIVLVDKIAALINLSDSEMYVLAGSSPQTLELIIALINRNRIA